MIRILFSLAIVVHCTTIALSQDIRGADFSYRCISMINNTYEGKLNLYVSNPDEYRPFVIVNWGPTIDTLFYTYQVQISANVILKEYVGLSPSYPGPGTYIITYQDTFRITGITNIQNSESESIMVENILTINPFLVGNNSPIVFSYQNNVTFNNNIYFYDPNVWDPDGDSLHFELIPCYATSYFQPVSINIEANTGIIQFYPDNIGTYAISYKIEEFRLGVLIGSSVKDMIIDVPFLTSVDMINSESSLSIFPNPFSSSTTIQVLKPLQSATLVIYDILGKEVKRIEGLSGKEIIIQKNGMKSGMYFYLLRDKQGVIGNGKMVVE